MATSAQQLSVPDQIRQLEGARKLVLGDVSYYPQVIQATLPIIGPSSQVEFRRWGAEFLAEAFATPALPLGQKETLCLLVLETLKSLVEDANQDVLVLRSAIQAAASIYPLAVRWIINNSYDTATWQRITAVKTRILRIWENAPQTIKICCVKFAQRVVLAQSPSVNPEPRRGDPLDISLAMIPPQHPVLDGPSLEAEAYGLLDRMLGALHEHGSDVLVVDATLNTLSILVRARPATSSRILNSILSFNPLKLASVPMTPKTKVIVKSMEKTTRMLLIHLSRRDPHNPQVGRIQQYVERLMRSRAEAFDENSRKRALAEQTEVLEAKRQKIGALSSQPQIDTSPLEPGPHTLAEVFTLTRNEGLKTFHVGDAVSAPLAAKISVRTIAQIDLQILDRALNCIRDRIAALHEAEQQPINPETAPLGLEEDDDDYEPDYFAAEDTEQLLNKLDSSPADERRELQKPTLEGLALPTFRLPPPPTLDPDRATKVGQGSVIRVFSNMKTLEDSSIRKSKAGINRLAASSYDRDSWITVLTRLATRTSAGLDHISIKDEDNRVSLLGTSLNDSIRELLYNYVLEDFRRRIDAAVQWLSEEWYNDQVQQESETASKAPQHYATNYEKWAVRLLDGFFPYLHAQDKVLMRFLSELPSLTAALFSRVKTLCQDPSLVNLALTSLYYLVMFRPPIRDLALDTVEGIWTEFEDSRPMAEKYLKKWRPGFLEAAAAREGLGESVAAAAPLGASGMAVAT